MTPFSRYSNMPDNWHVPIDTIAFISPINSSVGKKTSSLCILNLLSAFSILMQTGYGLLVAWYVRTAEDGWNSLERARNIRRNNNKRRCGKKFGGWCTNCKRVAPREWERWQQSTYRRTRSLSPPPTISILVIVSFSLQQPFTIHTINIDNSDNLLIPWWTINTSKQWTASSDPPNSLP